jgi:glycerol-3-phosphate dehydrogenase
VLGGRFEIEADVTVNAGGPWAGRVAAMANLDVPVVPTAGVMVSFAGRRVDRVVNRLDAPSDGDIVVPQRQTVVVGTSSWSVDDPDRIGIPSEHVALMVDRGSQLVPAVGELPQRGVFAAARPLIGRPASGDDEGRELSRTFACFDHAAAGVEGFVTISGGKTTTARAMAEATADVCARKVGLDVACRTATVPLLSYRAYFHD